MQAGVRKVTVAVSVALALFMVFVLWSTGFVAATPTPTGGTPPTSSTYGYLKTVSVGPLRAGDGWVYQGSSTVGYSVNVSLVTASSTSNPTFELSVERTMGVLFSVEFCEPSCSSPVSFANLSYHAYEVTDSWANFTTQGTVTESGAPPVTALALLNTSSTLHANVTERATSVLPSSAIPGNSVPVDRSKYLSASVASTSSVTFASPLGLIPEDLSSAQSWSSSSTFNATGTADYTYYYRAIGPLVNRTIGPDTGNLTVSPSGTASVSGSYAPQNSVTFNGVTYPAVRLTISGPFSVREGFILIPESADIFGSTSQAWSADQNGSSTVAMSYLDVRPSASGLYLAASSWLYTSAATNPGDTLLATAGAMGPAAGETLNPISSTTIQGTPQSPDQATSNNQCLTSGLGCPAVAGGTPLGRALFGLVALGGAVVAVVAVVAIVLITERRRLPPAVYPNAALYPPGASGARPGTARSPSPDSPPAPPAEDDPLDHLW